MNLERLYESLKDEGTREAYAEALMELGEREDIVVLDADLAKSTRTEFFKKKFPERFFDFGVAEQNMFSVAGGLAASGKTVFASTFAVFAACKGYDQIRMCIAQPNLNVKIVASHGGITVGEDGFSHQAVEDLALFLTFPNFKVIVPADAFETYQAVKKAASIYGPFYIRLTRPKPPSVCPPNYEFELGKARRFREGAHATIIATGIMVHYSLLAADELAREGIECRVINMSTLKPIDEEEIIRASEDTGAIVTVEDHFERGGLGSTVSLILSKRRPTPLETVALGDKYAVSGKPDELLEIFGLSKGHIKEAVRRVIERKGYPRYQ